MSVLTKRTKKLLINTLKPIQTHQTEPLLKQPLKQSIRLQKKNTKKSSAPSSPSKREGLTKYTESQHKQRQPAALKKGVVIDRKAD